ncbi:MAG: hypothetical protein QNK37_01885 [Acidobacteriota bacterium]|nr:hypothetical protein [Acidobacteriota bacterium]
MTFRSPVVIPIIFLLSTISLKAQLTPAEMGVNLEVHTPYARQIIFVDAFKRAAPWQTFELEHPHGWNTQQTIDHDSNGYPLEVPFDSDTGTDTAVNTWTLTDMDGHYPPGTWKLSFEGEGQLVVSAGSFVQSFEQAGTYDIPIDPSQGGVYFSLIRSIRGNHIRNIRLMMPDTEDKSSDFYKPLVNRLKEFSVVRFSQTMRTNDGDYPCDDPTMDAEDIDCVKTAANRPTAGWFTQATNRGIALEYLIDLANEADVSPWFCIPHGADDNYMTQMATLIHTRLNSHLKVYIELSNELWNHSGPYPQSDWAVANGRRMENNPNLAEHTAQILWTAKRSADMFYRFQQAFGADRNRLVRVLPGTPVPAWNNHMLTAIKDPAYNAWPAPHPNLATEPDVLAMHAYFGGLVPAEILDEGVQASVTPVEIVSRARVNIATDRPHFSENEAILSVRSLTEQNAAVALFHDVGLVAYEGGQHIVEMNGTNNNPTLAPKCVQANHAFEMQEAYTHLLNTWEAAGGGLFMHYSLVKRPSDYWGSFGLFDWTTQDQATAYKYQALRPFLRQPTP